ncbi:TPA: hypothetical protein LVL65_001009 [Klebsiella oxytoca]|nr:hypothetical protein [Klebsiella oxytoca]
MTTDITELAQSHELRNKVNHRLYGALEFQGTSGEHATVTLSIDECKSIIAAMDERLALVEALEKARQVDEELCKLLPPGAEYMDPPDGGDVTPLEGVRRMVADYRQRIAELESRTVTVKLPDYRNTYKGPFADEVEHQVRLALELFSSAAGIKWEAE